MQRIAWISMIIVAAILSPNVIAQQREGILIPAPNRANGEGLGPYRTFVLRGATLIDGTGAPPRGPVDIVVENNRIKAIQVAGTPGDTGGQVTKNSKLDKSCISNPKSEISDRTSPIPYFGFRI